MPLTEDMMEIDVEDVTTKDKKKKFKKSQDQDLMVIVDRPPLITST